MESPEATSSGSVRTPPDRADLLKLYEAAIAEYRFQVQLNWDRAKHYLVFNGVLLGAATGFFRLALSPASEWLVGVVLLFVALNSLSGVYSVHRGHQYYRNARAKKALFEEQLGLTAPIPGFAPDVSFAIETTPGMESSSPNESRGGRLRVTITHQIAGLLLLVAVGAFVGAILVFSRVLTEPSATHSTEDPLL